jgi:hypothetical protein
MLLVVFFGLSAPPYFVGVFVVMVGANHLTHDGIGIKTNVGITRDINVRAGVSPSRCTQKHYSGKKKKLSHRYLPFVLRMCASRKA